MAKQKQEEAPKGSPAWMSTFSDLMNLLLCFFVLLFSMSSVDAEKFEMLVASFQNTFSVLSSSGNTVGDGVLISSGISVMEDFDEYFNTAYETDGESDGALISEIDDASAPSAGATDISDAFSPEEIEEAFEEQGLFESEKMSEQIEALAKEYGISDKVELEFNGQYVELTISGALLFDSGEATLSEEALPLVGKIGRILSIYEHNIIEIEGHADSVPIGNSKYESNEVLSMYRAMHVAEYIRDITDIPEANLKPSGRGDYVPVADNATAEGRARNRRVEIKIYNSLYSNEAK